MNITRAYSYSVLALIHAGLLNGCSSANGAQGSAGSSSPPPGCHKTLCDEEVRSCVDPPDLCAKCHDTCRNVEPSLIVPCLATCRDICSDPQPPDCQTQLGRCRKTELNAVCADDAGQVTDGGGGSMDAGILPSISCTPRDSVITDLTQTSGGESCAVTWGSPTEFSGSSFEFGDISSSIGSGMWSVAGVVHSVAGFGLRFGCIVDASAFSGVEFLVSGYAGLPGTLRFAVGTVGNECPGCTPPTRRFTVSNTRQRVVIHWSDVTDGAPEPTPNPRQIISIEWLFEQGASGHGVDLIISDIKWTE